MKKMRSFIRMTNFYLLVIMLLMPLVFVQIASEFKDRDEEIKELRSEVQALREEIGDLKEAKEDS